MTTTKTTIKTSQMSTLMTLIRIIWWTTASFIIMLKTNYITKAMRTIMDRIIYKMEGLTMQMIMKIIMMLIWVMRVMKRVREFSLK